MEFTLHVLAISLLSNIVDKKLYLVDYIRQNRQIARTKTYEKRSIAPFS